MDIAAAAASVVVCSISAALSQLMRSVRAELFWYKR